MRLTRELTIAVAPERAWRALVEWGAGAPDGARRGSARIGAVAYHGGARLIDLDDDEHVATFRVIGHAAQGPATAVAAVTGRLEAARDGATRATVEADLRVRCAPAPGAELAEATLGELIDRVAGLLAQAAVPARGNRARTLAHRGLWPLGLAVVGLLVATALARRGGRRR